MLCKKSPSTWINAARTLTFSSSSTMIKLDGEAWDFLLEDFFFELKPWLWPCPFWCRIIPNLLTRRMKLKKLSTFMPCLSINLLAFCHECCTLIGYATHCLFCFSIYLLAFYHHSWSLIGYAPLTIYLNNRVFLSRNYRLIVAPRKFDVLKTNICLRSEASRANMLVLRTSNFQGATIRPIAPRLKHSIVFIVHH